MNDCAIGIDIGGTKIEIAIVGPTSEVIDRINLKSDIDKGPEGIVIDVAKSISLLLNRNSEKISQCGVAVAGQVDSSSEMVLFAPNLKWINVPLKEMIERQCGLKVSLLNDVRAALIGEWLYGAGRGASDCVCVFVGTGVGGGIVAGGQVLCGHMNSAGELGHMVVSMAGELCTCGNIGCVEAIASGWAIALEATKVVASDPVLGKALSIEANGREITAKDVSICASLGDPLSCAILDRALDALTACSVSIVNAFNPERLILGGSVFLGQEAWLTKLRESVKKRALKSATSYLQVLKADLNGDAGIIGAAAVAKGLSL